MVDRKILIVGPKTVSKAGAYGGGTGGYTRNMSVYLSTLGSKNIHLYPFYHTVRSKDGRMTNNFVIRILIDTIGFFITCMRRRYDAVHVLAQYRKALPREMLQAAICKLIGIPLVYDIKAGAFNSSYENGSTLYRVMLKMVINTSSLLFAEGEKTVQLIKTEFSRKAVFFPNFVPSNEIPNKRAALFSESFFRLLFVGYCYPGKGVTELVKGANLLARRGNKLRLDLIGEESKEFSRWIDDQQHYHGLKVVRHGKLSHEKVLGIMQKTDIYIYPTTHPGEGHNNSINEAMMNGLVILTTRKGFLENVLGEDTCYFIDRVTAQDIANTLNRIIKDKNHSISKAERAREKLIAEFTDSIAKNRFETAYMKLFMNGQNELIS